jgi:protein SCO1/2
MKSNGLLAAAFVLLALGGCTRSAPAPTAAAPAAGEKGERRFPLTGEIVRVDAEQKILVVRHDAVEGLMPAMTMEFKAEPGDVALAKEGQKIRADLIAPPGGDFRLEKIWPNDKVAADTIAAGARKLREDTHNLGKEAYREIGEKVPAFVLYDQDGRVVQSARFTGKQIIVNFIFTRCPDQTKCPAATMKMMAVQKQAAEAGVTNLELVSITLDPAFDSPGVLRSYADARGIDTKNFSFLTGPESAVKDLLTQFGVIAEFDGGLLKHTLATLLINQDGRIAHRVDGSMWEAGDFVSRMKKG